MKRAKSSSAAFIQAGTIPCPAPSGISGRRVLRAVIAMAFWQSIVSSHFARAQQPVLEETVVKEDKYPVGYRVLSVPARDGLGRPVSLDMAVWYPTSDRPQNRGYQYPNRRVEGMVAPNGAVMAGRFPLVMYSHGATGSAISSVFLTQHLASQGYIVAAPDHTDEFIAVRIDPRKIPSETPMYRLQMMRYMRDMRTVYLNEQAVESRRRLAYRPEQLRAATDFMLSNASGFAGSIDSEHMGLLGHSLGAWTSMLLAGADSRFVDQRFKSLVTLSGPVNPNIYSAEELRSIRIPTLMMYGTVEVSQGRGDDRGLFFDRMVCHPCYLLGIEGADHFTFSMGLRENLSTVSQYVRNPPRGKIVRYTEAFFNFTLKGDRESAALFRGPVQLLLHKNTD